MAFSNWGHQYGGYYIDKDTNVVDTTFSYKGTLPGYSKFDDYYLGLHVNLGAQYKQFLTWFDINFMPMQTSERPASSYTADIVRYPANAQKAAPMQTSWVLYDVE